MDVEIFIGWDPRERRAWNVCDRSIVAHSAVPPPRRAICRTLLEHEGFYWRPTARRGGRLWDEISGAPMSTEFALARFFVPFVARGVRWALCVDGDFMFRADVAGLLALADPRYAVQVVKHRHLPAEAEKMDGQAQTAYDRKNWSSCVLWNLGHAGCRRLLLRDANEKPGLWLHQFGWLKDHEIGDLPHAWNWLEGSSAAAIDPKAVHFTRGTPDMPGYEDAAYADEWRGHLSVNEVIRATQAAAGVPVEAA
jgi:hypothetical protein